MYTEEMLTKKQRVSLQRKEWYKNNREEAIRRSKAWYAENKEYAAARFKKWRLENKEHYAEIRKRNKLKTPAKHLWHTMKQRAARRGVPFDLTVEWIEKRLAPMRCEVTGVPLELQKGTKNNWHPWGPSIDQVKPGGGYTKKNCQIVCWAYNAAKQTWDEETVATMAKALLNNRKKRDAK